MEDIHPAFVPQHTELWAVRACSEGDGDTAVGLVVGWSLDEHADSSLRPPVVASIGPGWLRGTARAWLNEVDDGGRRGWRSIERVELYLTREEAEARREALLAVVGAEHDRRWPEDAPAAPAAEEVSA